MASLGIRTLDEMIGRAELLDVRPAIEHWKAKGVDLGRLLHVPTAAPSVARRNRDWQRQDVGDILDHGLIAAAAPALERGEPVRIEIGRASCRERVCQYV